MAWNSETGVMARTNVGIGDISQAVHYASDKLDILIKYGIINKWARYKPFRDPTVGFGSTLDTAWINAARAANYGLSMGGGHKGTVQETLSTVWEYLRPRGPGQGENGADEGQGDRPGLPIHPGGGHSGHHA